MSALLGLKDKLYWRFVGGKAHCFKKQCDGGFGSLCGRHELKRSGGGQMLRPEPAHRCGRCDGLEMERRGWDESGPATINSDRKQIE